MQGDIPASQMLNSLPGIDPARRDRLIDVLDIDPDWRMHLVSDGQRRRVQIAMGLLKPFQVHAAALPQACLRAARTVRWEPRVDTTWPNAVPPHLRHRPYKSPFVHVWASLPSRPGCQGPHSLRRLQ
jgi:hypothetical protein